MNNITPIEKNTEINNEIVIELIKKEIKNIVSEIPKSLEIVYKQLVYIIRKDFGVIYITSNIRPETLSFEGTTFHCEKKFLSEKKIEVENFLKENTSFLKIKKLNKDILGEIETMYKYIIENKFPLIESFVVFDKKNKEYKLIIPRQIIIDNIGVGEEEYIYNQIFGREKWEVVAHINTKKHGEMSFYKNVLGIKINESGKIENIKVNNLNIENLFDNVEKPNKNIELSEYILYRLSSVITEKSFKTFYVNTEEEYKSKVKIYENLDYFLLLNKVMNIKLETLTEEELNNYLSIKEKIFNKLIEYNKNEKENKLFKTEKDEILEELLSLNKETSEKKNLEFDFDYDTTY